MTSKVSICNLALANVAANPISSIDEASAEARACRLFYDHALDALLQRYPWEFAGSTQALAEVINTKPRKWGKAFRRPSDCLKVRRVTDELMLDDTDAIGVPYEVEGEVIFTDLPVAYLKYTSRQADPTKFPPLFVEALSWHLAVKLAMPLTRDPKIRADAFQLAERLTGSAEVADANETRTSMDTPVAALEARK